MARIDAFLKLGAAQGCSDVHLAVGVPPMLRMNGDLMPIKFRDLARRGARELRHRDPDAANQTKRFAQGHDLDFSYVSDDGGRFRVNVFRKETGVGAIFRAIPREVPTLESAGPAAGRQEVLRLPPGHGARDRLDRHRQVDHARRDDRPPEHARASCNIISLEDPIEFVHRSKRSQVDPARARHAPALVRRRRARRACARTRT